MKSSVKPGIDPSAVISDEAEIGEGVRIGPYVVIQGRVSIGEGTSVGPHTVIQGPAWIGRRNLIYGQSAIGTDPQDLKYRGEVSTLHIGDDNKIREFVTINRGTAGGIEKTVVGSGCLLMTGVHVAHDCEVGDDVILANSATLAGHVTVHDAATVGAFSGVHQFCRVGAHAFIGGYSVLTRDALPFIKTVGSRNRAGIFGVNRLGLQRRGFSEDRIQALRRAYRTLFLRGFKLGEAIAEIRFKAGATEDVETLLRFIETAERGFVRAPTRTEDEA